MFIVLISAPSLSRAANTITVAISHFPPVEMMVEGKAEGVNINLLNKMFSQLNLKPVYRLMPFKRCMKALSKGKVDIIGSLQYTDERAKFLKYIQPPYSESIIIFYVGKKQKHRLTKYEDLYKLKVGVMRGYKNFEPFDNDG